MIYDLCEVDKECTYKYKYNNGGKDITKEVLLDEYDFLWPKLRHMHIADCINKVRPARCLDPAPPRPRNVLTVTPLI